MRIIIPAGTSPADMARTVVQLAAALPHRTAAPSQHAEILFGEGPAVHLDTQAEVDALVAGYSAGHSSGTFEP